MSISIVLISMMIGILSVVPGHCQTASASIWTDASDYSPEQTVTIYGSGFQASSTVQITVARPDSRADSWSVPTVDGSFTTAYQLDGITGTYQITATDGTNTAATTFTDKVPKTVTVTTTAGGSVKCQHPASSPTTTVTVPPSSTNYQFTVLSGTHIKFTANPAPGYIFTGWSGDLSGTNNPQTVEVGSGKTITATFSIIFPVPEYLYGAIGSLAACFTAFIVIKRPHINLRIK